MNCTLYETEKFEMTEVTFQWSTWYIVGKYCEKDMQAFDLNLNTRPAI